jgi:hypothetical protein
MAQSLKAIFALFEDSDYAWLPEGVRMAGPDRRDDTSRARRITWEPVSALHTRPRRLGGGPGDDGEIMQRTWTIRVEVWGSSLDDTLLIANAFLGAAHELLTKHGFNGGQESWNPGGVTGSGSLCVIGFELLTPIPRLPKPTRKITEIVAVTTLAPP